PTPCPRYIRSAGLQACQRGGPEGPHYDGPLHGLDRAHQIHEARALKVTVALQICSARQDDLLHILRPADELLPDREKCGDDARPVRRGHAGAAVLDVETLFAL